MKLNGEKNNISLCGDYKSGVIQYMTVNIYLQIVCLDCFI